MPLDVKVWLKDAEQLDTASEAFHGEVDFVSLFNDGTYGPPPLVAPIDGRPPVARVGDMVLYVNTSRIAAMLVERLED